MLPAFFSLIVAAAGWYYLVQSPRVLEDMEEESINRRRYRLRRVGGVAMVLLAICFFAFFRTIDQDRPSLGFFVLSIAVLVLLAVIVILALIDLRLTWQLRRRRHGPLP